MSSDTRDRLSRPPARTPEGREQQLTSKAVNAIEKRIDEGRATAQELLHFANAGSPKAKLEMEILEKQKELITKKAEALDAHKDSAELYTKAMAAFQSYAGMPHGVAEYED